MAIKLGLGEGQVYGGGPFGESTYLGIDPLTGSK